MKNLKLLVVLLLSSYVAAQAPAEKLAAEGQSSPTLTDETGGRVPGSPAMDRAVRCGVYAFKAAGGENVRTEPVPMAASWASGKRGRAH